MFKITTQCDGCGQCLECCPVEGAVVAGTPYRINPELCAECGACAEDCPKEAIIEDTQ